MAVNQVFKYADWLVLPVDDTVLSGDPVQVEMLVGCALTDAEGETGEMTATVALTGAYSFPIADEVTDVGTPVYIDGTGDLTVTGTGNNLFGHALQTKAAGAGSIAVRLTGFSVAGV